MTSRPSVAVAPQEPAEAGAEGARARPATAGAPELDGRAAVGIANRDAALGALTAPLPFEELIELPADDPAFDGVENWLLADATDKENLGDAIELAPDEFALALAFAEDTIRFDSARTEALLRRPEPAPPPPPAPTEAPDPLEDWLGVGAFPLPELPPVAPAKAGPALRPRRRASLAAAQPEAVMDAGASIAALLASCDASRWGAPEGAAAETGFLVHRNFKMALDVSRSIDVRLSRQEARTFARSARWGLLRTNADAEAFLFMADALRDATAAATGLYDVDASFADWRDGGAPSLRVENPGRATPETDVDQIEVIDDLGEDQQWQQTFWMEVDRYLTELDELDAETPTTAPAAVDPLPLDIFKVHFWTPGDTTGLMIEGSGADIFFIGVDDAAAAFLVEDGSSHSMRTGAEVALDAVVVSWSQDRWTSVDSMRWRPVATLRGVTQVRVEQNHADSRLVIIAGDFCATELEEEQIRLVKLTAEGDVDYTVMRLSGFSFGAEDQIPFSGAIGRPESVALDF